MRRSAGAGRLQAPMGSTADPGKLCGVGEGRNAVRGMPGVPARGLMAGLG